MNSNCSKLQIKKQKLIQESGFPEIQSIKQ